MNIAKISLFLCVLFVIFLFIPVTIAESITPQASYVFDTYAVQLNSNKSIKFSCEMTKVCSSIQVTSCTIQKKITSSDGSESWDKVTTIFNPASTSNADFMNITKNDYTSYFGSGTYRVKATFYSSGESRTATSNSRTFY